jgi:hypothetical protein
MSLSESVSELFRQQLSEWKLARVNYSLLSKVQTRKLEIDNSEVLLQFNPERIKSSAAKVDIKSIESRPCFLCSANRPPEQRGVRFGDDLTILVNPFPIFNRHLTIPSEAHTDQRIESNFSLMLSLAEALPEYVVFYNGPQCGASAPDHFHFQAGNRRFLPLEGDFAGKKYNATFCGQKGLEIWYWSGYLRGIVTFEGSDRKKIEDMFTKFYNDFAPLQPMNPEPMLNILAYFNFGRWVVHIIPRKLHRPAQFFAEGAGQIIVSPASVDLGGVIITPREEDFRKINADDIKDIFSQVCLTGPEVKRLFL